MEKKSRKSDPKFLSKDLSSSGVQKEERKPLSNKLKYLTAAVIFYGNIAFGCGVTTYGLALTSFQNKYNVDDSTISAVFTIQTCGVMVGALCGGIVFNHVNRQLAVIISFLTMATVMFYTPHCPTLSRFFFSASVMGIFAGCYDAAQIVWMMEMMQKECPPFVLAQHFCLALGTILSTLIMAPFLKHDEEVLEDEPDIESKLVVPYTIIGFLIALTTVAQTLLFMFMRYRPPPPEINANIEKIELELKDQPKTSTEGTGLRIGKWSIQKIRMVALASIFLGAYVGMEISTFEFFSKFGQNSNLKLSEKNAAYTLTAMTTSFAAGRGLGTIVAIKIRPQIILCANIALVTLANILLFGWANDSLPVLWFCSISFGIGFSTLYPVFCAYIERYLRFTNFIGGIMIVSGAAMASLYPLIIGGFIEENPVVLSYTTFFSIALVLITFLTLGCLTTKNKTRY